MALQKQEGNFVDHYKKLEAYSQEIGNSNHGSDVIINISKEELLAGKRRFLRMYIYFYALKQGWKNGLRPFVGLDETFFVMTQFPLCWVS